MVYFAIGALGAWFASTAGFNYTGSRIIRRMKIRYMEAVLRQNMAFFDSVGSGQLVAQLGADMHAIQEGISQKFAISLSATGTLVAAYAVSFALCWKLAFILTWSFFLSLTLLFVGNNIAVRVSRCALEAQSTGTSIVEESLGSIRSTTALGLQQHIVRSYDNQLDIAEKAGLMLKVLTGTVIAITVGTGYLNVALGFWQGSRFLVDGETSPTAIITITLIMKLSAFCVLGVGQNAETFTTALAAARQVFRIMKRLSPIDSLSDEGRTLDQLQGNIEMRNIQHIYPSRPEVTVVTNLNITFPASRTTAVVGPSGSGKSSIAKLLMRFYEPVKGNIFLDDCDIQDLNLRWLRRQIRTVIQEPFLFDTTILANIEYGFVDTDSQSLPAWLKRQKVEEVAKIACAHEFISCLPQGYDTMVGSKGSKLSGGQRQRIAIARALVADPRILILDEATSAMDTKTEAAVANGLSSTAGDRTTIIVAHRLSTVQNADNILVLKEGTVLEQGKHAQLVERRGPYFDLVQAQRASQMEDEAKNTYQDNMDVKVEESTKNEADKVFDDASVGSQDVIDEEKTTSSLYSRAKFVMSLNVKEYHLIFLGLFCSVIAGMEEPASAILFGKAVVAVSTPHSLTGHIRSDVGFWAWMFFLLAMVMMLAFGIQGYVFAYCSERLVHRARILALKQILRFEIAFFDKKDNSAGALSSSISTDAAGLAGISGGTLGTILIAVSTLTSAVIVGMAFGWKLALVCSSIIPVLIGSGMVGVWVASEYEKINEQQSRASAAFAGEAISAIQTVASLAREPEVLASYEKTLYASAKAGLKANLKMSLVLALARAGVYACMALGFWYGGNLILRREYSLLQFVVVYSSIITSAYSAGLVFSFTPDIGGAMRSAYGLQKLLQRNSSIDSAGGEGRKLNKPQGRIDFRGVTFAYPSRPQQQALRNISFTIPAGSTAAFVGHTGCGKSTVVSLLERFYDPSSGAIFLDGDPIRLIDVAKYRRHLGIVNQEPTMFRGSIKTNLIAGLEEESVSDAGVIEACKQANIHDFIMSLP